MNDVVRWLLGLRQAPDWVAGDSAWQLQFQSLPSGVWAVALAVLAVLGGYGIWRLYKSELSTVSRSMRVALATLRSLVLVCVALMLLELVLVISKRESEPSHLLVLVDTSQSMGLNDPYPDDEAQARLASELGIESVAELRKLSRLDLSRRALEKVLGKLNDGRELSINGFAGNQAAVNGADLKSLESKGAETAIGDALAAALAEHRGQPIAGVLVISDGQSNAGEDPRKAAEQAAQQGIRIASLAVGSPQGPSNARLAAIEADPVVFVRDPTEVNVLVEGHGLQGRSGVLTLEKRQDAAWSEVGREEVSFTEDSASKRVSFKLAPEAIGDIEFRARLIDLGSELTEADNTATHMMKVVRQQIRVLLIAGAPSPEVQFLRNALLRDTGLEFACWLQAAGDGYEQMGTRPIRRLPNSAQELDQYDVVVLFDPDVRALGPGWSELISQFVGMSGGGLIFVAGEMHTRNLFDGVAADSGDGTATVDNAWLRTLPVVADPGLFTTNAEVALSAREPFNLELTPEGSTDQVFQFDVDPGKNREVLASLPGMYWHFPVTRAKPGAMVLARHGDPRMRNSFGRHVLLAVQRYGPGRTAFLGFDSTYRWRYLHEEYFDGFWARLIDRLGRGKALGGRYPFALSTDKASYRTGERVTIRATAIDPTDGTSAVADLRGEVELAGQAATPLDMEPAADRIGVSEGSFTATDAGAYTVRILPGNIGSQNDPSVRPATVNLRVASSDSELDRPKLDMGLLEDVARATGGRAVPLTDFASIPDLFEVKQVARTLEYRDELWDAPILFGGLMVLLTAEWVLRKRARMA